jgi:HsdM N-terminal domain
MIVRTTVKSIQDIMRQDVGIDGDAQRISQLTWMFFLKIIDDQDQELELTKDGYRAPIPKQYQWRGWAADSEGTTGEPLLNFINDELFPALKELKLTGKPGDRRRVVRDVFEDAYNYMKSGQLLRQVVNKINQVDFTSNCSMICNRPAMPANIIRRAPSPPSWPTASTHNQAKSCSIPPAALAASSPVPSATWRRTTSKHPSSARRCTARCAR